MGPSRLGARLNRFGRRALRTAAAPRAVQVEAPGGFLRGLRPTPSTHSEQAFLFDRQAGLAFRTLDMPSPSRVLDLIAQLAHA